MSQYVVEAPDGTKHIIEGPDNTPPPSAADAAHAAGVARGQELNPVQSGILGAMDTGTLGASNYVTAGLRYAGQHIPGVVPGGVAHPDDFSTDLSYAHGANEGSSAANPYSTLAGDAAGVVLGATPLKGAISLATRAPGIAGRAATSVLQMHPAQGARNILRAAGLGGLLGGTQAANDTGGDPSAVAYGTGGGAVGGAAMGVVARPVMKVLSPAGSKANALLAKIIGVDEPTLAAAHANFRAATATPANPDGTTMPMAALMSLKQQGALRDLAAANPVLASELMGTESAVNAARPARMADVIESHTGAPQDINTLRSAVDARMTAAMKPLRSAPVTVDANDLTHLLDPDAYGSLRANSPLKTKLGQVETNVANGGTDNTLTVSDIDNLRQAIRGRRAAAANPANAGHNPHTARELGDLMDNVSAIAGSQHPDYAAALDEYAGGQRYIDAFQHGLSGNTLGEADASSLRAALLTAEGVQGHSAGVATRLQNAAGATETGATRTALDLTQPGTYAANREAFGAPGAAALHDLGAAETGAANSLASVSPSGVRPEDNGDPQAAYHALAALTYHTPAGILYHAQQLMRGLRMSKATAGVLARYLTDPQMTPQAYNILKRAGMSDQRINQWAGAMALSVGSAAGEGASAGRGQQ